MVRLRALGIVSILTVNCVATTTSTRTWTTPAAPSPPERYGRVEWIRETVQRQQGSPAGGAAVGAVVGGLLGHAIIGRSAGTLVGAVGGAAAGASASQGSAETRTYEVAVRFDDGAEQVFTYRGYLPFRVGDQVTSTFAGLQQRGPPTTPPPPPPDIPPPPG
jgi:outer membrane lipoprotein SlyB